MSSDPVRDFFETRPLTRAVAARVEAKREAARRNDAHDETGSMSEDEERERADWPR